MPGMVTGETRLPGITGLMPGMATPAPVAELRMAKGKAADLLFWTLMLTHHFSGIAISQDASEHAAGERVRALAEKIVVVQSAETVALRHMIAARS